MTKPRLSKAVYKALADTFMFYFLAHQFHWNVVGINFASLHAFFGDLYEDAHGAVDALAEHYRTLNEKVPPGLVALCKAASVEDLASDCTVAEMLECLSTANSQVVVSLDAACAAAEEMQEEGLANFLQERLDRHAKNYWMLNAHRGEA